MEDNQTGQETRMPVQRVPPGTPGAGKGGIIPPHPPFAPGNRMNPGGRRKGASILHEIERRLAVGAKFDEAGELVQAGTEACEVAGALIEVAAGRKDPADVDVKAALALLDRVDGPVVKETRNENTHVVQGIELIERRASVKDLPKPSSAEDT